MNLKKIDMDIPRDYRFEDNPTEKKLIEEFINDWQDTLQKKDNIDRFTPVALTEEMEEQRYYLNKREEKIILNTIQWLGSPVGQHFLKKCGFKNTIKTERDEFEDSYPDHSSNQ